MRIAALIFGALAGFVASVILALGGLEATKAAFGGISDQQLVFIRFALIFIANLSLLGAGVALAIPRAAAVLTLLSGVAWAIAAYLLGHNFDLVLLTPPALALISAGFAVIAEIVGGRNAERERLRALDGPPPSLDHSDNWDRMPPPFEAAAPEPPFAATKLRAVQPLWASLTGLNERDEIPGRLTGTNLAPNPIARPPEPTFRPIAPQHEAPSRKRFGRSAAVLSFLLYASLAGAAAMIFLNFGQDADRSLAVAEQSAVAATPRAEAPSAAPTAPSAAPQTPPPAAVGQVPVETPAPSTAPAPAVTPRAPSATPPGVVVANPTAPAPAIPERLPRTVGLPLADNSTSAPVAPAPPTETTAGPPAAQSDAAPPLPAAMSEQMRLARKNGGGALSDL